MNPLPHHPHYQSLARTQTLISTNTYSSLTDAVQVTGHPPHRLRRMVQEGSLPTRKTGAQARAFETHALVSEAYRQGRLLLTDLLRSADGSTLDETDLATELTDHHAGTWYSLARQAHRPPDWRSWHAWYSGDRNRAQALLTEEQRQHLREADDLASRRLTRRHLWCPPVPLSAYGRYQDTRYRHLADAGAHVRVLPAHVLTYAEAQGQVPDLEILPNVVYVRHYTAIGARNGATRVTNPELVGATLRFVQWLYTTHATLLKDFTHTPRAVA